MSTIIDRVASLSLILLLATHSEQSFCADETFIVIDAVSETAAMPQPTWIALYSSKMKKLIHLRAGQKIHKLRSTRGWMLAHVDYIENPKAILAPRTQSLTTEIFYRLRIEQGKINYIGLITVSPEGENRHQISWSDDLLRDACLANPDAFRTHPVVGKDSEVYIDCSQWQQSDPRTNQ